MSGWIERLRQNTLRRKGRRLDKREEAGQVQQWFLLAGRLPLAQAHAPDMASLHCLYPPDDAFWADPFVWIRDGRTWVFFEDFCFATWRGHISVIELGPDLQSLGPAVPVIREPYHLSYPFLFEYGGELYMLPEKCEVLKLEAYRCVEFPHRWEPVATLMDGVRIADATLLEHEGRWWLLGAVKQGRVRINESLFAFHADSPLSTTWTPHPANPLVRDLARGRPGGRVLRNTEGEWIRPSQDCVRRYGHALRFSRIDRLTPDAYAETPVGVVASDWRADIRANHHWDWRDGVLVMDAQRLIPRERAGLGA